MPVWDCFTFNNELDLLELRLRTLDPVVDHFVLVEAALTHAGDAKPLAYEDHRDRFAAWRTKIVHVVADLPAGAGHEPTWQREHGQRRAISDGLRDAHADDLVLVSDLDEIPDPDVVRRLDEDVDDPVGLVTRTCYYCYNLELTQELTDRTRAARARDVVDPHELRFRDVRMVADAGWHLSYLGDADHIAIKTTSIAESTDVEAFASRPHIRRCMKLGIDYYRGRILRVVADEDLPAWIRAQRELEPHLFHTGRGRLRMPVAWPYALATRQREALGPERMDRHPVLTSIWAMGRHATAAIRLRVRRLTGRAPQPTSR